jgi:hypothetical protein
MYEADKKQNGEPIDPNQTYTRGFVGQNISRERWNFPYRSRICACSPAPNIHSTNATLLENIFANENLATCWGGGIGEKTGNFFMFPGTEYQVYQCNFVTYYLRKEKRSDVLGRRGSGKKHFAIREKPTEICITVINDVNVNFIRVGYMRSGTITTS